MLYLLFSLTRALDKNSHIEIAEYTLKNIK